MWLYPSMFGPPVKNQVSMKPVCGFDGTAKTLTETTGSASGFSLLDRAFNGHEKKSRKEVEAN